MDYIFGSFYILKNKIWVLDFSKNTVRIKPKLPWYRKYIYFYSESNQIINNLYLGSSFNAYSISELTNKKINVIINITEEIDNFHENNLSMTYYRFPIKDNNQDDISDIIEQTYDLIDEHLSKGDGILVHCFMGASRSATVIIYYLMKKYNITYEQALSYVSNKRKVVNLSYKFDWVLRQKNIKLKYSLIN
jgi:protein-tyrosine phosphatase